MQMKKIKKKFNMFKTQLEYTNKNKLKKISLSNHQIKIRVTIDKNINKKTIINIVENNLDLIHMIRIEIKIKMSKIILLNTNRYNHQNIKKIYNHVIGTDFREELLVQIQGIRIKT